MQISGHFGSANSAAIKAAGLSSATKSPEGSIVEKDRQGEHTGVFYNHRAMDLLRYAAPPITAEMTRNAILQMQPVCAAAGMTSFHDNNIRDTAAIAEYQDLTKKGDLYMRNTLYLTLEYPENLNNTMKVDQYQDKLTRFAGYKFLIDGSSLTAYFHPGQ